MDKIFVSTVKVTMSSMQSLTQEKKIVDKIRVGREIGKIFLLVKTSSHMVVILAVVLVCKASKKDRSVYVTEAMMQHDIDLT